MSPGTSSSSDKLIHVGVWQGQSMPGDVEGNLRTVKTAVGEARKCGVKLLLFPELFLCGYDVDDNLIRDSARSNDSDDMLSLGKLAQETGVCIAIGYAELDSDEVLYNSCALFDARSGSLILNYRKINLWGAWEQSIFARGSSNHDRSVNLHLSSGVSVLVGCLICYDIEFPEPARALANDGVQLLLVPTALGSGEVESTTPLKVLPTRAVENHLFILYSNLEGKAAPAGVAKGVPSFCGRSAIIAPDGTGIARAPEHCGGKLFHATLHLDGYTGSVLRNPYLSDRWDRMKEGHYRTLLADPNVDGMPLGVQREKEMVAFASSVSDEESERVRVQKFVEKLQSRDFMYGQEHESQFICLYLPDENHRWLACSKGGSALTENYRPGDLPVLFLVHGGFWKEKWRIGNTQPTSLVPDFLRRGFAVALVEYRRREMPGGLYPGPENDVTKALQHLAKIAETEPLDLTRVLVLGHSAGGKLALAACHAAHNAGSVLPILCVSVAPVPDMLSGYEAKLSDEGDAIEKYMGFHPDNQERREKYKEASLSSRLPLQCQTLLVTGTEDTDVPPRLLRDFYQKCVSSSCSEKHNSPMVEMLEIYGADHYDVITANHKHWRTVMRKIAQLLQERCGCVLPPHPDDYNVCSDRGFLPSPDPMLDCSAGLGEEASAAALFGAWEAAARVLPSHLGSGTITVRNFIFALPEPKVGNGVNSDRLESWQRLLLSDEARAERAFLVLSWLGHAHIWGEDTVASNLPPCLAVPWVEVAKIVGRPPILTYYSFNANNWRRLDKSRPIELGNTCRINNFLGGQDEEWFSAVHVAIEAIAGQGLLAAVRAQRIVVGSGTIGDFETISQQLAIELCEIGDCIQRMIETLRRMKERCDPYIYYMRVRVFMKGWTSEELANGMEYCGVPTDDRADDGGPSGIYRREHYFGETGAQSSVIPSLDAALGLAMSDDALLPYLLAMREYMPPMYADFISSLERGPSIRDHVTRAARDFGGARSTRELVEAYNRCINGLFTFRSVHFELAYSFVRKWDRREDDEIQGTGGTPFMPYLKKHRVATNKMIIELSE